MVKASCHLLHTGFQRLLMNCLLAPRFLSAAGLLLTTAYQTVINLDLQDAAPDY